MTKCKDNNNKSINQTNACKLIKWFTKFRNKVEHNYKRKKNVGDQRGHEHTRILIIPLKLMSLFCY